MTCAVRRLIPLLVVTSISCVQLAAVDAGEPLDAGVEIDAGADAGTDAGVNDCSQVIVRVCSDRCDQSGRGRASPSPVSLRTRIEGPADCIAASAFGPNGAAPARLTGAPDAAWSVEFVADTPGFWRVVAAHKNRPEVASENTYEAIAAPTLVQPCLRLQGSCRHLSASDKTVRCDERLLAFDGGLIATLADGGFFLDDARLAVVGSTLARIEERGVPGATVPISERPSAWAMTGSTALVVSADAGLLVHLETDGGLTATPVPLPARGNLTAFFLGEDRPVLAQEGVRLCDLAGRCVPSAYPGYVPLDFHSADGVGVTYNYQTFQGRPGVRVTSDDAGGFMLAPAGQGIAFSGTLPTRPLYGVAEGFSLDPQLQRAFVIANPIRFGASSDSAWAATSTESVVFCE